MSQIHDLIKLLEGNEDVPVKELTSAFLPVNMELVSANTLLREIQKLYGQEIGQDFMNFVLKKGFPKHKDLLIEFFKSKNDVFSRSYLSVLEQK